MFGAPAGVTAEKTAEGGQVAEIDPRGDGFHIQGRFPQQRLDLDDRKVNDPVVGGLSADAPDQVGQVFRGDVQSVGVVGNLFARGVLVDNHVHEPECKLLFACVSGVLPRRIVDISDINVPVKHP